MVVEHLDKDMVEGQELYIQEVIFLQAEVVELHRQEIQVVKDLAEMVLRLLLLVL